MQDCAHFSFLSENLDLFTQPKFSFCVISPFIIIKKHSHTHAPLLTFHLPFPACKSFPYLPPFALNRFPLSCNVSKFGDELANLTMPLSFIVWLLTEFLLCLGKRNAFRGFSIYERSDSFVFFWNRSF